METNQPADPIRTPTLENNSKNLSIPSKPNATLRSNVISKPNVVTTTKNLVSNQVKPVFEKTCSIKSGNEITKTSQQSAVKPQTSVKPPSMSGTLNARPKLSPTVPVRR
jgi:hypothetical protein